MGGGSGFGGGPGGPGGRRPQGTFFKNSSRNPNSVGNNWRQSDGRSGGGFRGGPSGGHGGEDRGFPETQFLTNVDTMPNNGYGGYKNYNNSNFFPNYWN